MEMEVICTAVDMGLLVDMEEGHGTSGRPSESHACSPNPIGKAQHRGTDWHLSLGYLINPPP